MTSPTVPASPTLESSTARSQRLVTALFRNQDQADDAIKQLVESGVPRTAMRLMPGYERDRPEGVDAPLDPAVGAGFTAVADQFFRAENARSYDANGFNQGGWLVSVETTDADHEQVLDVLGQNGTIDEDEPDVG